MTIICQMIVIHLPDVFVVNPPPDLLGGQGCKSQKVPDLLRPGAVQRVPVELGDGRSVSERDDEGGPPRAVGLGEADGNPCVYGVYGVVFCLQK